MRENTDGLMDRWTRLQPKTNLLAEVAKTKTKEAEHRQRREEEGVDEEKESRRNGD